MIAERSRKVIKINKHFQFQLKTYFKYINRDASTSGRSTEILFTFSSLKIDIIIFGHFEFSVACNVSTNWVSIECIKVESIQLKHVNIVYKGEAKKTVSCWLIYLMRNKNEDNKTVWIRNLFFRLFCYCCWCFPKPMQYFITFDPERSPFWRVMYKAKVICFQLEN